MNKAIVSRAADQVTARILDAAQAEFMRVGYEQANTNRMAADHGISKATIFRHFGTKKDLFEAVIQRIASRWRDEMDLDDQPERPAEWLEVFGFAALHWLLSAEALFVGRMAIAAGESHREVGDVWPRHATRPVHDRLTSQIIAWQQQGLIAAMPAEDLAQAFLDLTLAGQVSRALYACEPVAFDEPAIRHHVRFCVALFLQGCGQPKS